MPLGVFQVCSDCAIDYGSSRASAFLFHGIKGSRIPQFFKARQSEASFGRTIDAVRPPPIFSIVLSHVR